MRALLNCAPRQRNAMTVDVEDWFQVQAYAGTSSRDGWDSLESRVEQNTDRILAMFAAAGVTATFFTLGWVASRHPALVRRIVAGGHELASHGFWHRQARAQTPASFAADVGAARLLLQDVGGVAVTGYRAPTFSIGTDTPWAYDALAAQGYRYSSSIYPVRHDAYGDPGAPRFPHPVAAGRLVELPMTTVRLARRNFPAAGGGFFRLLPYDASRAALDHFNRCERASAIFYIHPWELDTGQPGVPQAPALARLRHKLNLRCVPRRLTRLLGDFAWGRIDDVFADVLF
jgi:polysaccharide deacetylase family protein (PEP-CTERM system associated)